jgi:oxygen-independent coproporphyrinogen-3 oxidase
MQQLLHYGPPDLSEGLSLYFHVPFCQSKCHYCDFFSSSGIGLQEQQVITQKSYREAAKILDSFGVTRLETLYIGGGTPSLLSSKNLSELLTFFSRYQPYEFTIEINPQHAKPDFINFLWDHGITRISMGIQSLDETSLFRVGRFTSYQTILEALEAAAPFAEKFSFDIMAGLPGQTETVLLKSLDTLINLKAGHISFYSLTVEEETPLFSRQYLLPSAEQRELLWESGHNHLLKNNYTDYEISNYARSSRQCSLHNQRYWRLQSYLGAGPGAVSTLVLSNGTALRINNTTSLESWLKSGDVPAETEHIDKETFMFEHFMMALRTREGLSKERFFKRFKTEAHTITDKLAPSLRAFFTDDDDRFIKLSDTGRRFLNTILAAIAEI